MVADEVDDRQPVLPREHAQAATELLQEDDGRLRRLEHHDTVDPRVQDAPVAVGCGVVDLVSDDVVEGAGREAGEVLVPRELLDGREHHVTQEIAPRPDEPAHPEARPRLPEHPPERAAGRTHLGGRLAGGENKIGAEGFRRRFYCRIDVG